MLAAFLCTTCSPAPLVLTSAAAARLAAPPTERISQAGMRYGHCAGVVLAVVLSPEPCGWEQTPSLLAGR